MAAQPNGLTEVGDSAASGAALSAATITVVVPVYNALATLSVCLDSLLAAMAAADVSGLVVVDNGSRDGSYELLCSKYADRARIVREPGVHVGQVRNVGAAGATTDVLAFVDSDCVVERDYFTVMRRVFEDRAITAAGSTYALPDDPGWIERTWDALHAPPSRGAVAWINAGNFAIRRGVFEQLGGFDATLESGEDTQIGARLRKEGYVLFEEPSLRAVHLGNPKTLGHFFKKHVWHGMGILGTPGARELVRRPLIMLSMHIALTLAGVAAFFATSLPMVARVALLAAGALAVPAFSVGYRLAQSKRSCNLAEAVLLYFLYYTARLTAVAKIAGASARSTARVDSRL